MPCSICRQTGHNRSTCPRLNHRPQDQGLPFPPLLSSGPIVRPIVIRNTVIAPQPERRFRVTQRWRKNIRLVIDDIKFLNSAGLAWYRSSALAQRGFCRECGSTLFWKPDSGDRLSIFVGTIDGAIDLPLSAHIYLAEKGSYYEITDDAEQHLTTGADLSLANCRLKYGDSSEEI